MDWSVKALWKLLPQSDFTWREAVDSDNQKGEELFTSGEGKH